VSIKVNGVEIEVLPRRPRGTFREELRESQRGRMICAVVDTVAAKGYAATAVADVIAAAGVSRATFYAHFTDKEDCFLASYDEGAKAIFAAMVGAADGHATWRDQLDAVLGTWLATLDADRAFTRAHMVEFWGAGDAARARWTQRRDRTGGLLMILNKRARKEEPDIKPVSETIVAAVVGGINRIAISHLLSGDERPLTDLKPELVRFVELTLAARS
jgi:AcrR family transcriptional regulator